MTIEEIKILVTTIIASLGGITGIVAIINGIVRIITSSKQAKSANANSSVLGSVKTDLLNEIERRMNCALDVDISAVINPVLEQIENKYLSTALVQTDQMFALKELMIEIAQMMSSSRKLSEDDRLHLLETISKSNAIIVQSAVAEKPKLSVKLSAPDEEKQVEQKRRMVV